MWTPGKLSTPSNRDESTACARRSRLPVGLMKSAPPMGSALRSGYALPSVRPHRRSHPDGRWILILIAARHTAAEKAALPLKKQLFFQSKQPMPEAAKRWDALVADWCKRDFDLWLSQQRSLAHVDFEKGINLTPHRQQEAAQGSWRERRRPVDKERD